MKSRFTEEDIKMSDEKMFNIIDAFVCLGCHK